MESAYSYEKSIFTLCRKEKAYLLLMPGNDPRVLGRPGHSLILTPNARFRPQSMYVRNSILFSEIIKPLEMIKGFASPPDIEAKQIN
jgi:hypothetical protein